MSVFSTKVTDQEYREALEYRAQSEHIAADPKKLKKALYRIEKYEDARDYAALTTDEKALYDKLRRYKDIISPAFGIFRSAMPDEIQNAIPENIISIGFRVLVRFMIDPQSVLDGINERFSIMASNIGVPSHCIALMVSKPTHDTKLEIMVFSPALQSWTPVGYDIRGMLKNKQIKPNLTGQIKEDILNAYHRR